MKQILIATHGKMASGIRYTAELIVGKMDEITTIDAYVTPEDNVEKKFEEYFAQQMLIIHIFSTNLHRITLLRFQVNLQKAENTLTVRH